MSTPAPRIFEEAAPKLWEAGLSAIPLIPRDKKPLIRSWSAFSTTLPATGVQGEWITEFPTSNVGVAMGPASDIIALDIDTDDPLIMGVLEKVMPLSPWVRVGAKGKVWIYKYNPSLRTFRVDDDNGVRIFELLCAGIQIVVPPSIHPTTQRPYHANRDLAELCLKHRDLIRPLPNDIEAIIRDALDRAGVRLRVKASGAGKMLQWLPAGGRDSEITTFAGQFAHDITDGKYTLLEACEAMKLQIDQFTEKVWGDTIDPRKGVSKIVEFMLRDVMGPRKKTLPLGWDAGLTPDDKKALGVDIIGDENRRWEGSEIVKFFQDGLARPGIADNPDATRGLAEAVLVRIAGNANIGPLEESQILRMVVDANAKTFTVADMRRKLSALRKGDIVGEQVTEIADAALADLSAFGEIRYHNKQLWQWQGSHWKLMDESDVQQHFAEHYAKYPVMRRQNDHRGALEMFKIRATKQLVTVSVQGINFVNGFLTEEMELLPHNPDFGMTYVLPYPYLPDIASKCPLWLRMLSDYWGDDEDFADKMNALQEAFAVTLFGIAPRYQRAFVLSGLKHSGKSRITLILEGLMPDGCISRVLPTDWSDKFAPAEMVGKLLNIAGEISETHLIDGEMFKMIVGGEVISAQRKHAALFTFRPTCAQWFAGNHLPRSRDSSGGFTRRFFFFKFNKEVSREPGQYTLDYDKVVLAAEREAIAAWAVQGLVALKRQGHIFTEPASHLEMLERVAEKNNSVRLFLSGLQQQGKIRLGEEAHKGQAKTSTTANDLWTAYRSFCLVSGGVSPVGQSNFFDRMEELQGAFGFLCKRVPIERGGVIPTFLWLTLASGRVA